MKLYIAGRYSRKNELRNQAQILQQHGVEVTSSWLMEPDDPNVKLSDVTDDRLTHIAKVDLFDVRRADGILFYAEDPEVPHVRGGRHVEFGFALGVGKAIFVIGPKENVFHYLPSHVRHFPTLQVFIDEVINESAKTKAVPVV